jgi:hypothetical protein
MKIDVYHCDSPWTDKMSGSRVSVKPASVTRIIMPYEKDDLDRSIKGRGRQTQQSVHTLDTKHDNMTESRTKSNRRQQH